MDGRGKSIAGKFAHYVGLNILSMIGMSLYILADTFFISKGMGANGLAALNVSIPIYNVINGAGLMCGIGGAARFVVFRVQGDRENADRVFTVAMRTGLVISILLMAVGLFLPWRIAGVVGARGPVRGMASTYIRVILLFAPFFIFNNILNAFVKNDGAPRLAMCAMLSGTLFNIVFDYILIFPAGLGILGAVLATACAPLVGILVLLLHFVRKRNSFALERRNAPQSRTVEYRPGRHHLYRRSGAEPVRGTLERILALGLPSFISEAAAGAAIFVFNLLMLRLGGTLAVAAYGVIANIYLVIQSVFTGIAQGIQPLLGQTRAENDTAGFRQIERMALILEGALSVLIYILVFIFRAPLVALFNSEGSAGLAVTAEHGLPIYFLALLFMGLNQILSMVMISEDKGGAAQLVTFLRGIGFLIPAALCLSELYGLSGAFAALPFAEALTYAVGLVIEWRTGRGTDPDIT